MGGTQFDPWVHLCKCGIVLHDTLSLKSTLMLASALFHAYAAAVRCNGCARCDPVGVLSSMAMKL